MIYIDANVFLRYLVSPATPEDARMSDASAQLFDRLANGEIRVTTSEATLAEVIYILTDKKHYCLSRYFAASALRPLISSSSFRLQSKLVVHRALELWESNSSISFPDSIAAAYSEVHSAELATFDERIRKLPTVILYDFLHNTV